MSVVEEVDPLDALAEPHFTIPAVAQRLRIHESTVWRWVLRGLGDLRLPTFTVGGRRLVREDALRDFLRRRNAVANGEQPHDVPPTTIKRRRQREIRAADAELAREGL